MRPVRGAVAALGLVLAGWPLAGVAQTTITPDVGARGLGTTVTAAGSTYAIDGGTRAGGNLFHSFQGFSLGAGDVARWSRSAGDAAAITNVINRVTGGQVSTISGTLDSTALPNASFYFINPAGVVFGAGARVNVPGAAHFSTAAELRFADGAKFSVATPSGSTLSMAAPESFGFLGASGGGQGAISVSGATDTFAAPSSTLTLTASDIRISDSRFAVRGLDLVAVGAGASQVSLADPLAAAATGAIDVRNSRVTATVETGPGAPLRLRAGAVSLDNGSFVADVGGPQRGGDLLIKADALRMTAGSTLFSSTRGAGASGDVLIDVGDAALNGGTIGGIATGAGATGRIALTAETIGLANNSLVATTTNGTGAGGNIDLIASKAIVAADSFIIGASLGDGAAGQIHIKAPLLDFTNGGVQGGAFAGGNPGDILLEGAQILIGGGTFGSSGLSRNSGNLTFLASDRIEASTAFFTSGSLGAGSAGSIFLRAPTVILDSGFITSNAFGDGGAGALMIDAGTIVFNEMFVTAEALNSASGLLGLVQLKATGDLTIRGGFINSNANGVSDGGRIVLEGGRNVSLFSAEIGSDSLNFGNAGKISVTAGDTLLIDNSRLTSNVLGEGDGGQVSIQAPKIVLDRGAAVRSDTLFQGDAGGVLVKGGSLLLLDGSAITSRSEQGTGNAGTVLIDVGTINVTDGTTISSGTNTSGRAGEVRVKSNDLTIDGAGRSFAFIASDSNGSGDAGDIFIDTKTLTLRRSGSIFSSTGNGTEGNAGTVNVLAETITIDDGAYIASDSFGEGTAGGVNIRATKSLRLTGGDGPITYISSDAILGGDAGTVSIQAGALTVENGAFISSDALTFGDSGDLEITADTILLRTGGALSSRAFSNGDAGTITVNTRLLTLETNGVIASDSLPGSLGDAGGIEIHADTIRVGPMTAITTASAGEGDAGAIAIFAKDITVDGGVIASSLETGSLGTSGLLGIDTEVLRVVGGGQVSTVSNNTSEAGLIAIVTKTLVVDGDRSLISSENLAGDPMRGNPRGERGDAGSVLIASQDTTISNGGRITTNSFAGAAGSIVIAVERPGLLTLESERGGVPGSIQTSSGAGTGGKITIADPLAIISNGGSILALGQQSGANVVISSKYFINSTDRTNTVAVDGVIDLQTGLYDVSSGTVSRDLSVLDASRVLQGQCPVTRSTGVVSQLITRPVGPYVREPEFTAPPPLTKPGAANIGACP